MHELTTFQCTQNAFKSFQSTKLLKFGVMFQKIEINIRKHPMKLVIVSKLERNKWLRMSRLGAKI